jgi:predicted nucleic acid-binding protein
VKVFFDTNVLASALATRGFCAEVFELTLERHDVVLGEPVLTELERVLRDKLGVDASRVRRVLGSLGRLPVARSGGATAPSLLGSGPAPGSGAPPDLTAISDPDDVPVVASALAAGADVLVTGDATLRKDARDLPLQVLSPRQYWELLRFHDSPRADEVHEPEVPYAP